MNTIESLAVDVKYIRENIDECKVDIREVKKIVNENYLTKDVFEAEFKPVRNLVYGMVAIVLVAVIGAIIALVINGRTP